MPYAPARPCLTSQCAGTAVPKGRGRCAACAKAHEKRRGTDEPWRALYQTSRWRKERIAFLKRNPLCVDCMKEGRPVPATVVDHMTPHRGDFDRFWSQANWQPQCASHHSEKTALEVQMWASR